VGTTPKDQDQGDDQGCSAGIAARILTRYVRIIRKCQSSAIAVIFANFLKLMRKFSYRENSRTPFIIRVHSSSTCALSPRLSAVAWLHTISPCVVCFLPGRCLA
jgi:hypothetical protein